MTRTENIGGAWVPPGDVNVTCASVFGGRMVSLDCVDPLDDSERGVSARPDFGSGGIARFIGALGNAISGT